MIIDGNTTNKQNEYIAILLYEYMNVTDGDRRGKPWNNTNKK